MYISKKNRELVRNMFDGKCAYTGTELQSDWQVDHVKPVRRNWWLKNSAMFEENHKLNNMLPSQRIINHYKQSMDLEQFRNFMKDFHIRVSKLPKNPKIEKSIKRKIYILEIARLFDIKTDKAFSGIFYFETLS
jgi:5-methylcytosine-specific restriction endonuclease McrA